MSKVDKSTKIIAIVVVSFFVFFVAILTLSTIIPKSNTALVEEDSNKSNQEIYLDNSNASFENRIRFKIVPFGKDSYEVETYYSSENPDADKIEITKELANVIEIGNPEFNMTFEAYPEGFVSSLDNIEIIQLDYKLKGMNLYRFMFEDSYFYTTEYITDQEICMVRVNADKCANNFIESGSNDSKNILKISCSKTSEIEICDELVKNLMF